MQPPLFFAPVEAISNNTVTLPRDEANHAATVLRLQVGAVIIVVDGLGVAYRCDLSNVQPKKATVCATIRDTIRNFGEPAVKLTLAAGLSSASKFDTIVEKGTEVGVSRFVPVVTEKSKIRLDDERRATNKVRRLERVALAAMKQCRRSYRPEIAAPVSFSDFLRETSEESLNLCFHTDISSVSFSQIEMTNSPRRVTVLIGPESGFSAEELSLAVAAGYKLVHLGRRVLRTETAGPLAAALVMFRLGELS